MHRTGGWLYRLQYSVTVYRSTRVTPSLVPIQGEHTDSSRAAPPLCLPPQKRWDIHTANPQCIDTIGSIAPPLDCAHWGRAGRRVGSLDATPIWVWLVWHGSP